MRRMKVTKVMNLFCSMNKHDKCKGTGLGNSNDRETFICTCECHSATNTNLYKIVKEEN
jgi:hypothetical protein